MKKLALGVLFAALSACGGGNSNTPKDAPSVDAGSAQACNPLAAAGAQGCATGDKCTWVVDNATTEVGELECVTDGSAVLGAACTTADTNGSGTGPDDCALGGYCIHHICEAIRDTAETVAPCGSGRSCGLYTSLFTGVTPALGVCDATCDQLTQNADAPLNGNTIACGGTLVCSGTGSGCGSEGPTLGCYAEFDKGVATCTGTPEGRDKPATTDDVPCTVANDCANATGSFLNGCAPGFIPFYFDTTGSTLVDCTAFCAPLDTDSSTPQNVEGDGTALGKLPTDPAPTAGHAKCEVGVLAHKPGETCQFLWPSIIQANVNTDPATNPYLNNLGTCFRPADFTYDPTNGTGSGSDTKVPEPPCSELRPGSGSDVLAGPGSARCSDYATGSEQDCFAVIHGCYSLDDSAILFGSGSGSGSAALRRLPPSAPRDVHFPNELHEQPRRDAVALPARRRHPLTTRSRCREGLARESRPFRFRIYVPAQPELEWGDTGPQ